MDTENLNLTLTTPQSEIENRILLENDLTKLNQTIEIFNAQLKKKDILRLGKLTDLQDAIVDQIYERMDKKAGEFSNKDLIDYFKVVQDTISKSDNNSTAGATPIQITQNQVNINVKEDKETFDRASRARILNAVNNIISNCTTPTIENTYDSTYTMTEVTNNNSIQTNNIIDVDESEISIIE